MLRLPDLLWFGGFWLLQGGREQSCAWYRCIWPNLPLDWFLTKICFMEWICLNWMFLTTFPLSTFLLILFSWQNAANYKATSATNLCSCLQDFPVPRIHKSHFLTAKKRQIILNLCTAWSSFIGLSASPMAELLNILDRQTDLVTQINYRGSGLLYEWQNKSTK